MNRAGKVLELETLMENFLKSHKSSGFLRLKVLYFASIYHNLSVSFIIEKLGIKKSNFALLCQELEKEGLLEQRPTEIDRRCKTIILTEKGREELENYLKQLENCMGATTLEIDSSMEKVINFFNKLV